MVVSASAKLLKERAAELRQTAAEIASQANTKRNESDALDRQSKEQLTRAAEYESAAAKLGA